MGKRRRGMFAVQSAQGRPTSEGSAYVAGAGALSAQRRRPASQRPAVSAQLPARKLDGLSLLGFGARTIAWRARRDGSNDAPNRGHGFRLRPRCRRRRLFFLSSRRSLIRRRGRRDLPPRRPAYSPSSKKT